MKKRRLWIAIGVLLGLAVLAALLLWIFLPRQTSYTVKKENAENFGALLRDLVEAYENPGDADKLRIAADLEAIRRIDKTDHAVASAIAEHWQHVYLDKDYTLLLHADDTDAAAALVSSGIPDSRSHAIVVLGYELKDGQMQPELVGRCEAAAALARVFPSTILV